MTDNIDQFVMPQGGDNQLLQLIDAHSKCGAMPLIPNCGYAKSGEVLGDATGPMALLDRYLHHTVVVPTKALQQVGCSSLSALDRTSVNEPRIEFRRAAH